MVQLILRGLLALCLVALFWLPLNMMSSLLWIGGFTVFVYGLRALVRELRGAKRVPFLVVSLATVALFFSACLNLGKAMGAQGTAARAFAGEVQAMCARDGKCPTAAAVCTPGVTRGCREAGSVGIRHPIRYELAADGRAFTVSYWMDEDSFTKITGGVDTALKTRSSFDGSADDAWAPTVDAGAPAKDAGP